MGTQKNKTTEQEMIDIVKFVANVFEEESEYDGRVEHFCFYCLAQIYRGTCVHKKGCLHKKARSILKKLGVPYED